MFTLSTERILQYTNSKSPIGPTLMLITVENAGWLYKSGKNPHIPYKDAGTFEYFM